MASSVIKYEGYFLKRSAVYPNGYSGRPLLLNSRSAKFVELVANGEVALARGRVQAVTVQDGDAAPAVADQSGLLEGTGALGDRGPAGAEHLGKEVLGDLEAVGADPVMGLRQPPRRAFLGGVQSVAHEILCEEGHHGLGVAMQQVVQGTVLGQESAQSDSFEPKSLSRDLAEAPMRAGRGAEERG